MTTPRPGARTHARPVCWGRETEPQTGLAGVSYPSIRHTSGRCSGTRSTPGRARMACSHAVISSQPVYRPSMRCAGRTSSGVITVAMTHFGSSGSRSRMSSRHGPVLARVEELDIGSPPMQAIKGPGRGGDTPSGPAGRLDVFPLWRRRGGPRARMRHGGKPWHCWGTQQVHGVARVGSMMWEQPGNTPRGNCQEPPGERATPHCL